MMTEQPLRFIERAPVNTLPPGERGVETTSLNLDRLPDGIVSGNALVDLSQVPANGPVRPAVSLALVFASRVADAAMREGDNEDDWFAAYQSNLKRLGFMVPQTAVTQSRFKKTGLFVHRAILPFLTVALGGAGVGPIILAALSGLAEMDKDKPWITLLEREAKKFDVREMHFAAVISGETETTVRHVVARLSVARSEASVLFFRVTSAEASFESATTTFAANNGLLATIEPLLRKRLSSGIADFIADAETDLSAPPILVGGIEARAPVDVTALMKRLSVPAVGGPESAARIESSGEGTIPIDERLRIAAEKLRAAAGTDPELRAKVEQLIEDARVGLDKVEQDGEGAAVTEGQFYAAEAVVEIDGSRPVLFVQDGSIDLASPDLVLPTAAPWQLAAGQFIGGIERVVRAVGAVQLPKFFNERVGTAFAIAPGLVLTNRHVVEEIARFDGIGWRLRFDAEIEFCGEFQRDTSRAFRVEEVVCWGPDPINRRINYSHADFAILRLAEKDGFPEALTLATAADSLLVKSRKRPAVYAVGFPAEPQTVLLGIARDAPAPRAGQEYEDVLRALFHDVFSRNRWSPGLVEAGPGQLAGDAQKWVFAYDASTLAGSSGSAVVDFADDGQTVVGLHFGGAARRENWAHAVAALTAIEECLAKAPRMV